MTDDPSAVDAVFEQARDRLVGVAYRMVGAMDDAEDVVQEAWLRWNDTDQGSIANPHGWLTTVTTRLAIDRLRQVHQRREDYLGPWLPEPIVTDSDPAKSAELSDSLTLGFLTMLDRLTAVDRAVFLLADVFGVPYADIAEAVGRSESACRQVASRSRRKLRGHHGGAAKPGNRAVADALVVAVAAGDMEAVLRYLSPEVVAWADGGGLRRAAVRPVVGADRVARFMVNLAKRAPEDMRVVPADVNGDPGVVVVAGDAVDQVVAFQIIDGLAATIWIVRNPEKLGRINV